MEILTQRSGKCANVKWKSGVASSKELQNALSSRPPESRSTTKGVKRGTTTIHRIPPTSYC
eukprot:scaffold58408_cov30-Attheya_sp.AAC.2